MFFSNTTCLVPWNSHFPPGLSFEKSVPPIAKCIGISRAILGGKKTASFLFIFSAMADAIDVSICNT